MHNNAHRHIQISSICRTPTHVIIASHLMNKSFYLHVTLYRYIVARIYDMSVAMQWRLLLFHTEKNYWPQFDWRRLLSVAISSSIQQHFYWLLPHFGLFNLKLLQGPSQMRSFFRCVYTIIPKMIIIIQYDNACVCGCGILPNISIQFIIQCINVKYGCHRRLALVTSNASPNGI